MKQVLLFLLFLSIHASKAQGINNIILDSIEVQTDIFKENERILSEFKSSFIEKDSLMVTNSIKGFEEFQKKYEYSENWKLVEVEKKKLENEQKGIMVFEESIIKADSVLKLETRAWVKDYIKKVIRFYGYSKNIKPVITENEPLNMDKNLQNLNAEIIDFINKSAWKTEYDYRYNFIKHKVLFDFKLE